MNAAAGRALPAWAPTMAMVVGGDEQAREHIGAQLGAAGFALRATPRAAEAIGEHDDQTTTVIVALATGTAPERVRAVQALAEANPHTRIIATMPDDSPNASLRRALRAGAAGIVFDGELEVALVPTANAVAVGQLAVPGALRNQIAPRALSYREKQILGLVVLGFTNREIADKLYLAESTIKTHLSSAFAKLDAHSRSEAAARILDPEAGYGVGILAIAGDATTAPG